MKTFSYYWLTIVFIVLENVTCLISAYKKFLKYFGRQIVGFHWPQRKGKKILAITFVEGISTWLILQLYLETKLFRKNARSGFGKSNDVDAWPLNWRNENYVSSHNVPTSRYGVGDGSGSTLRVACSSRTQEALATFNTRATALVLSSPLVIAHHRISIICSYVGMKLCSRTRYYSILQKNG